MDDSFKIYIDRLKEGRIEKINEKLDPSFMDIAEADLSFDSPVVIKGEAELTEVALLLRLNVETMVSMPCSICNKQTQVKITIPEFCHTEDLHEIRGGIFDYREVIREAILLELPLITECQGGCPEREGLSAYFSSQKEGVDENYFPFKNL